MKTHLICYASGRFLASQQRLIYSALRHGIDEAHAWDRTKLEQTTFYQAHKSILDLPRGSGYWLWKPFIIAELLKEIPAGDVVVYLDAGIEVIADLSPLIALCRAKGGILLFAGHYDDVRAPGPNVCGKWTKRDCFIAMGCDEPRYHEGQMLDASLIVLAKSDRSVAVVHEWLRYCSDGALLTDEPNKFGQRDLPGFLAHRHDQSILSLLAIRDGIELFRHPSQFGNHLKDTPYREQGEFTRYLYGAKGIYRNSPYKTLLNHHRGSLDRRLTLHRTIPAPRAKVYAALTDTQLLKTWFRFFGLGLGRSQMDCTQSRQYVFEMTNPTRGELLYLWGTILEASAPKLLFLTWNWSMQWPPGRDALEPRVRIDLQERGASTELALVHEFFPTDETLKHHAAGWDPCLDRLAQALGRYGNQA